jgi:hypothetical protein
MPVTLCIYDYYQINPWGPNKISCPTFMYEIDVINIGNPIHISFSNNVKLWRLKIVDPAGRVISSKQTFTPHVIGKYIIKYWITCDAELYTLHITPQEYIGSQAQKVFSLMGVSREGSLFDGEQRKNQNFSLGTHTGTHNGFVKKLKR